MRFVVATHGHCFDGMASAVLFTRLLRTVGPPPSEIEYRACGYGSGQARAEARLLNGDDNAILDYRFSPAQNLGWYFDHHRTAFLTDEHRAHFEERRSEGRYFFDPEYSSCTKLVADIGRERFGLQHDDLRHLIDWADRVDSASFDSAEQAVSRDDPMMQMVTVVEHYGDDAFLTRIVPELDRRPLLELAGSP